MATKPIRFRDQPQTIQHIMDLAQQATDAAGGLTVITASDILRDAVAEGLPAVREKIRLLRKN